MRFRLLVAVCLAIGLSVAAAMALAETESSASDGTTENGIEKIRIEPLIQRVAEDSEDLSIEVDPSALSDSATPATADVEVRDEDGADLDDSSGWMALPFLFYTPETELAGGAAGIYYFSVTDQADDTRLSDVKLSVTYTQMSQIIINLQPEIYFPHNQHHLTATLRYEDYPDSFYGIGNNTPASLEEGFTAETFFFRGRFETLLMPSLYGGLSYELEHCTVSDLDPGGLLTEGNILGSDGGVTSGLGLSLTYDNRNSAYFPDRGTYADLGLTLFQPFWGSDFALTRLTLDARHFIPLIGEQVLGLQAYVEASFGDVPFFELARLGGSRRMRGYTEGRYRDHHMFAIQAEYRVPIWWRIGIDVFAGVGDVFSSVDELAIEDLKLSGGAGLRIAINDDGLNVRFDYGIGPDTSGFYLTVGEAF